jgi:hypothetical protein
MIHCVLGFPSITAQDVYVEFQAQKVRFGWKHEPERHKHSYEAFISALDLLYTTQGLIFISFKKTEERKNVIISDQHFSFHTTVDQIPRMIDDVIVFKLYEMNGSGQISRCNAPRRLGVLKRDKFDEHIYEKLDNFVDLPLMFNK